MAQKTLIVIVGPTAIGKTTMAVEIAKVLNTEIISADSRQIYKEMSVGTAIPSEEDMKAVKHHFIHTISVNDYYNASMFENDVLALLKEKFKEKDVMIMAGGSGL